MALDILCITDDANTQGLHEQALQCFSAKNSAVMFGLGQLDVSSHKQFAPPKLMLMEAEYVDTLKMLENAFPKTYNWVRDTPLIVLQSHVYNVALDFTGFNVVHTVPIEETTDIDAIRACVDIFDLADKLKKGKVVTAADYTDAQASYAELQSARGTARAAKSDRFPKRL